VGGETTGGATRRRDGGRALHAHAGRTSSESTLPVFVTRTPKLIGGPAAEAFASAASSMKVRPSAGVSASSASVRATVGEGVVGATSSYRNEVKPAKDRRGRVAEGGSANVCVCGTRPSQRREAREAREARRSEGNQWAAMDSDGQRRVAFDRRERAQPKPKR
jgi:hypothetical protein